MEPRAHFAKADRSAPAQLGIVTVSLHKEVFFMMHILLIDSATRAQLGIFLFDRPRPEGIEFKTWVNLIDGNIAALEFQTIACLCDEFGAHKIFELLGWPDREPRIILDGANFSLAGLAQKSK